MMQGEHVGEKRKRGVYATERRVRRRRDSLKEDGAKTEILFLEQQLEQENERLRERIEDLEVREAAWKGRDDVHLLYIEKMHTQKLIYAECCKRLVGSIHDNVDALDSDCAKQEAIKEELDEMFDEIYRDLDAVLEIGTGKKHRYYHMVAGEPQFDTWELLTLVDSDLPEPFEEMRPSRPDADE
jgi:hypothetical protein